MCKESNATSPARQAKEVFKELQPVAAHVRLLSGFWAAHVEPLRANNQGWGQLGTVFQKLAKW